jgi:hypothetical protein
MRSRSFGTFRRQISSMALETHHDRPLGRNGQPNAVQCLTQERSWPQQRDELLGALVAAQAANK